MLYTSRFFKTSFHEDFNNIQSNGGSYCLISCRNKQVFEKELYLPSEAQQKFQSFETICKKNFLKHRDSADSHRTHSWQTDVIFPPPGMYALKLFSSTGNIFAFSITVWSHPMKLELLHTTNYQQISLSSPHQMTASCRYPDRNIRSKEGKTVVWLI